MATPPNRLTGTTTVRLGGLGRGALLEALRAAGVALNDLARELLADPRFTTGDRAEDVQITARSVRELGFAEGATYAEIVARARDRGWAECPLELGPRLRLLLTDEPDAPAGTTPGRAPRGALTVASPALDDRDDTPKGFYLRRVDGVPWLRGYRSWPGHVWAPTDVLVFACCSSLRAGRSTRCTASASRAGSAGSAAPGRARRGR